MGSTVRWPTSGHDPAYDAARCDYTAPGLTAGSRPRRRPTLHFLTRIGTGPSRLARSPPITVGELDSERIQCNLEQAWVRLLAAVLERKLKRMDEMRKPVVLEMRAEVVVNVADYSDTDAPLVECVKHSRCIHVWHACIKVCVPVPYCKSELVVEACQSILKHGRGSVQLQGAVRV